MKKHILTIATGAALGLAATTASAATLDDVKAKGFVQCGVNTGLPGFANPNDAGAWVGFDVDYCKAVAAAVFGDPEKVKYTPLTAKDRFRHPPAYGERRPTVVGPTFAVLFGMAFWTFAVVAAIALLR